MADGNELNLDNVDHRKLQCRDLGHQWKPDRVYKLPSGYERVLVCNRCTTRRVSEMTLSGYIVKTWYVYPSDYRIEGLGRLTQDTRASVRRAALEATAIVPKHEED